eukprot:9324900-Alexandrium_andersonii.AAC.1
MSTKKASNLLKTLFRNLPRVRMWEAMQLCHARVLARCGWGAASHVFESLVQSTRWRCSRLASNQTPHCCQQVRKKIQKGA